MPTTKEPLFPQNSARAEAFHILYGSQNTETRPMERTNKIYENTERERALEKESATERESTRERERERLKSLLK